MNSEDMTVIRNCVKGYADDLEAKEVLAKMKKKKPWFSMKTAPKDQWILLVEEGSLTGHHGFRYVASYWDQNMNLRKGGWVEIGNCSLQVKPLAWMPFPFFKR